MIGWRGAERGGMWGVRRTGELDEGHEALGGRVCVVCVAGGVGYDTLAGIYGGTVW